MCLKKCMKWAKKTVKRMTLLDISLLKTSVLLIGIIIGAFISEFVKQYIWWFTSIAIVTYVLLIKRIFM
jgi:uncharacterized membrane protein YoaK (UPF0700 family)